jgi:hypothetical protein
LNHAGQRRGAAKIAKEVIDQPPELSSGSKRSWRSEQKKSLRAWRLGATSQEIRKDSSRAKS